MPTPTPAFRLIYIDGLRGIIALWIVFTHCFWEVFPDGASRDLAWPLALALQPIAFANKVVAFMVISGYCMALPLVRNRQDSPRGGVIAFGKRRMFRILPPYYAALILSLLLIALVPALRISSGVRWDVALPAFTPAVLWSHVLLLHNFSPDWLARINPPFWSLAVEWQIYGVFLFLLLPLSRRFGAKIALGIGIVLGFLPHLLLPTGSNFDWSAPWYLSLFCVGVAAASAFHHPERVQRPALAATLLSGFVTLLLINTSGYRIANADAWRPWVDVSVGLFTASLLTYCTSTVTLSQTAGVLRFCQSRVPVDRPILLQSVSGAFSSTFSAPCGAAIRDPGPRGAPCLAAGPAVYPGGPAVPWHRLRVL